MSVLGQEIVHAARSLRKSVGFSAAAIVTLALGIASTTAIVSIVDSVLLRPLPFPQADRIVVPESFKVGEAGRWSVTYADFMDWRDNHVFGQVAVYQGAQFDLTGSQDPVRVRKVMAEVADGRGGGGHDLVHGGWHAHRDQSFDVGLPRCHGVVRRIPNLQPTSVQTRDDLRRARHRIEPSIHDAVQVEDDQARSSRGTLGHERAIS